MRRHNATPEARERRRQYNKTESGAVANRKAQVSYRTKHPKRVAAQQKVRSAGADSGHQCRVCGKPATHKHHKSYGGDGGTIEWLCHQHHVKAHHPTSTLGKGGPRFVILNEEANVKKAEQRKTTTLKPIKIRPARKTTTMAPVKISPQLPGQREVKPGTPKERAAGFTRLREIAATKKHPFTPERAAAHKRKEGIRQLQTTGRAKEKLPEGDAPPKKELASKAVGGGVQIFASQSKKNGCPGQYGEDVMDGGEPFSKPAGVDEAKWGRAEQAAGKQGHSKKKPRWGLVQHIYQQMKKGESTEKAMHEEGEELVKSFLSKAMYDDNWYDRFMGSPFEAEALRCEEKYLAEMKAAEEAGSSARKQSDKAWSNYDKRVSQARKDRTRAVGKNEQGYKRSQAIREKYTAKRKEIALKYIKHRREQAEERHKNMGKSEEISKQETTTKPRFKQTKFVPEGSKPVGPVLKPGQVVQTGGPGTKPKIVNIPRSAKPVQARVRGAKELGTAVTGPKPPAALKRPSKVADLASRSRLVRERAEGFARLRGVAERHEGKKPKPVMVVSKAEKHPRSSYPPRIRFKLRAKAVKQHEARTGKRVTDPEEARQIGERAMSPRGRTRQEVAIAQRPKTKIEMPPVKITVPKKPRPALVSKAGIPKGEEEAEGGLNAKKLKKQVTTPPLTARTGQAAAPTTASTTPSVGGLATKAETAQKGESVPMVGGVGAGMMKSEEAMEKAMNTLAEGELTSGDLGNFKSDTPNSGGGSSGQKLDSDPKSGMPAGEPSKTEVWSADDKDVDGQMSEHKKPLEASEGKKGTSERADLERSANQVMEHYGMKKSLDSLASGSARDVMRQEAGRETHLKLRYDQPDGPDLVKGLGIPPKQEIASEAAMEKARSEARTWHQGQVLYTDFEDRFIEKAMNDRGDIVAEPTLGIPHAPLTSMKGCGLCKSAMPAYLTTCPSCGVAEGVGPHVGSGHVVMEKSVAEAIRPSAPADMYLPLGNQRLTDE